MTSAEAERDRLNAIGRDWAELRADRDRLAERCPICTHEWRRHDPENGKCDAHAKEGFGACPCGRDISYHRVRNAALSRLALDDGSIARAALARTEDTPPPRSRGEEGRGYLST